MSKAGVEVFTWGTDVDDPGDALSQAYTQGGRSLWGGNVGHAAFRMTLKDTEQNRELINRYLSDTGIPYQRKTYQTMKAEFAVDTTSNPRITNEVAYKENVIEIYFSYWPSDNEKGYTFYSFNEDAVSEREGVNVNYDERWRAEFESEQRAPRGLMRRFVPNQLISLNVQSVAHLAGRTEQESKLIKLEQDIHLFTRDVEAASFLISKLDTKITNLVEGKTVALSPIEQKVIKRFLPDENVEVQFDLAKLQDVKKKILAFQLNIHGEKVIARFRFTQALIEYNGEMLALPNRSMSEEDSKHYNLITDLRRLHGQLLGWDPGVPDDLIKINRAIKFYVNEFPMLAEYKDGIKNRDEYKNVINILKKELDPKQNGLIKLYASEVKRGDLIALYDVIESIERLRKFKLRLDAYVNAKGSPNEEEKKSEFVSLMQEIKANHDDAKPPDWVEQQCMNDYSEMFKADYIAYLQSSTTDYLNPTLVKSLYSEFTRIINAQGNEVLPMLMAVKADALFQQVISAGMPPSGRINLPIEDPENGVRGLNAEAMLREMSQFVKDARIFNLVDHNCSVSSSRILAAGAGDKGPIFKQAALSNSLFTPQVVFNNAVECAAAFRSNLAPGEPGYLQAVQDYFAQSFIYRAGNIGDPNRSNLGKVFDFAVGGASALTAGSIGAVRGASSAAYNVLSGASSYVSPASSAEPQAKPEAEKRSQSVLFNPGSKQEAKAEVKAKKPTPSTAHLKDTSPESLKPKWPGKKPKKW